MFSQKCCHGCHDPIPYHGLPSSCYALLQPLQDYAHQGSRDAFQKEGILHVAKQQKITYITQNRVPSLMSARRLKLCHVCLTT